MPHSFMYYIYETQTFCLILPFYKEQFKLEKSPQLKGLQIEGSKVVEHSIPAL